MQSNFVTMSNYIQTLDLLRNYAYLGEKKYEDGTTLIGKAPHIAPQAWLHFIYAPLADDQIERLESETGLEIPTAYKEFLKVSNGLGVFHAMNLYGYRSNYRRTVEAAQVQPFDITTPNMEERPKAAGRNVFYIGGYSAVDGAWLFMDTIDNSVHVCKRWKAKSLRRWSNLEEFLSSEINRLIPLFDREGKEVDPEVDTRPVKMNRWPWSR